MDKFTDSWRKVESLRTKVDEIRTEMQSVKPASWEKFSREFEQGLDQAERAIDKAVGYLDSMLYDSIDGTHSAWEDSYRAAITEQEEQWQIDIRALQ